MLPRLIDAHQHWIPQSHLDRLDSFMRAGESVLRRGQDTRSSFMRNGEDVLNFDEACVANTDARLADMDEAGVDAAVLQMAIWLEFLDLAAAREANDELADVQAKSGGRLIGLAHVPPFGDGAEQELERAVRELGLKGVNLTTHWGGIYPDEPPFRPFFRKVAELGVPVVVHASGSSGMCSVLDGDGTHLGRVTDQTLIVTRLLKSDLLEELPSLRFMLPQLGGSFWAVKRRLRIEEPVSTLGPRLHLLKQIWFDTAPALWSPAELSLAVTNLGTDRLLFGTDYPSSRLFLKRGAENIRAVALSDADRESIFSGNAESFFGLESAAIGARR